VEDFSLPFLLIVIFLGAASLSLAGAGVRLVTDHSHCRPRGYFDGFLFFGGWYRGWVFSYAITEELHAIVFIP
jgi:hypothetical protein